MKGHGTLLAVVGPTASGKSARAVELAEELSGEVISVDSRQVYRTLDIGTEKITPEEMRGVPHYLIDVLDPRESYSAGQFVKDAERCIDDIRARGKTPILAGGTHFYFDALVYGLPEGEIDPSFRNSLEPLSTEDLFSRLQHEDPKRASRVDPHNRRRIVRALELVACHGSVPEREMLAPRHDVEWVVIDPPKEELRERIDRRLERAFSRGLIEEVERVREYVGDARLKELGLEYRILGEYLRGEREESSLLPSLSSKLWHYARHQKAWLKTLASRPRAIIFP